MEKNHLKDEELFFYVIGDLDPDTIARIEQHLRSCEFCQDRLVQEKSSKSAGEKSN